jgi:hypothetical protein
MAVIAAGLVTIPLAISKLQLKFNDRPAAGDILVPILKDRLQNTTKPETKSQY